MFYFTTLELVKVQGYNAYLQWSNGRRFNCITISDDSGVFCENMVVYGNCDFRSGFQNRPCIGCVTDHNDWLSKPCELDYRSDYFACDGCGDCGRLGD